MIFHHFSAGALLPIVLLNRFGRKKLLFTSLMISGMAAICAPWVSTEQYGYMLLLSMIGKSSITFAFSVLYIFTAELWPTNLRTTILNLCSMTGRMGGALAPLTTLLVSSLIKANCVCARAICDRLQKYICDRLK